MIKQLVKLSLLLGLAALVTACQKDASTSPDQCAAKSVAMDGDAHCVYQNKIIETGFRCPAGYDHRTDLEGFVICSRRRVERQRLAEAWCDHERERGLKGQALEAACASTKSQEAEFTLPELAKVDYLFVIDNSGSMCEEQAGLTRDFENLASILHGNIDYRIAVISTDLRDPDHKGTFMRRPAEASPALNCFDAETGEAFVPDTADCDPLREEGPTILSPSTTDSAAALAYQFRCRATLGTSGDGFEGGLEAMRLALSCQGPNRDWFGPCCQEGRFDPTCEASTDFLRPDATLSVVILSDENDCSAPSANPAASQRVICRHGATDFNDDGVPDGYRNDPACQGDPAACFAAECGDLAPQQCFETRCVISRSENSNCEWFRDTLVPVSDYVDFLRSLKAQPDRQIEIHGFVGPPELTESGAPIRYNPGEPEPVCDPDHEEYDPQRSLDACCPEGQCIGPIQPSCQSDQGFAFSGWRYVELADAFGPNGCGPLNEDNHCSVCADAPTVDLDSTLTTRIWLGNRHCISPPPICIVSGEDRECNEAERADPANYTVSVEIECSEMAVGIGLCHEVGTRVLDADEWILNLDDDACPDGVSVMLALPTSPGTILSIVWRYSE